jgi:hypothetical protein
MRWRGLFSIRFVALYVALAVNAIFIGAYFWSAGGATTHVRIEAANGDYVVFVDGKRQVEAHCEQYDSGAVFVKTYSESPAAALPGPSGLDRLLVTDADSGKVLYRGNSSSFQWTLAGDRWYLFTVGDGSWRNYYVDAYFNNVALGAIGVHSTNTANGIVYSFRPFRHLDNGLDYVSNGKTAKCPVTWGTGIGASNFLPVGDAPAPGLELAKAETLKSMLVMTLRPYPYVLAGVSGLLMLAVMLHLAGAEKLVRRITPKGASFPMGGLAILLAAAAFGMLFHISRDVNQAMPHVPDEVSYVFQAKIFASFRLTTPVPDVKSAFNFFYPSLLTESGGHWASIYPFGHPIMLALGELVGAVWLVPPIIGALCILLIFAVGRHIYGARVGIVAAALLAFSPFFQMTASNLMSHNTAVFYLLACLFLITVDWKRKSLAYGLAGICFGLLLNTRPLTAAALVPPFALLFGSDLWIERGQRMAVIRRSFVFAAGVLVMVAAFYMYNLATSGSLGVGYGVNAPVETVIGFGDKNSVARGMENEQADLASLVIVLNGWPLVVGLGPVLLPFILGNRSRWDVFLLVAAVCAIGVWTAYEGSGLMHGPRYWYEAIPFFMLLAARGFVLLQDRLAQWAAVIVGKSDAGPPVAIGGMLSYGLLVILLGISVHGWVLGKHFDTPRNDYAPRTISELKGFNGADNRLLRKVDEMNLHHAVVLVNACPNWQCYGTVFWKNDVDFDGDVIYARDLPEMRAALAPYFDRKIYLADYGTATVVPYDPFPLRLESPGA